VLSEPGRQNRFDEPEKIIRNLLTGRKLRYPNVNQLWKTICLDKKAKYNQIRFVLLKNIGYPVVRNIDKDLFAKALENLCESQ
jgi:3-dehydroquinate synthetase